MTSKNQQKMKLHCQKHTVKTIATVTSMVTLSKTYIAYLEVIFLPKNLIF